MKSGIGAAPQRVRLQSFGVRVEVEFHDPGLLPAVSRILPPGWRAVSASPEDGHFAIATGVDGRHDVLIDGVLVAEAIEATMAVHVVDAQLRARIASRAPDFIFVHAGVVVVDGHALVLPGRSFCGKTTLVAALVAEGAVYFSDEFAPLDADGRVHPYPKPLSIRAPGERRGDLVAAESLGGSSGGEAVPAGLIAGLTYRAGAPWSPRTLSAGAGALALLANTVPARTRPAQAMAAVTRAAAGTRVLSGDRGEASETARILLAQLTDR